MDIGRESRCLMLTKKRSCVYGALWCHQKASKVSMGHFDEDETFANM